MSLTSTDIDKLIAVFPTKVDFSRIEERMDTFEATQKKIFTALDRLATTIEKLNLEYAAISEQLSRHERWIREIARKSEVALSE